MINPNDENKLPFKINGNWDQQSPTLKEKFVQLNGHDADFIADEEESLLLRITSRLNLEREVVIKIINKGN